MSIKADEKAFKAIIEMIVNHKVTPGERLYEPELVHKLNMSRTPIRQALCKLVAEGIVDRIPHQKGYIIPSLSKDDMLQVFTARANLEGKTAELAALNSTPDSVEKIRRLMEEESKIIKLYGNEKKADFSELNEKIHTAIVILSGNKYLLRDFKQLYWRSNLYTFNFAPYYVLKISKDDYIKKRCTKRPLSSKEHIAILEAISAKDPQKARNLMEEHIMNTVEYRIKINFHWE